MQDRNNILRSRKAQVGETVTWIIATIVIIVILLVFVFVSSVLAKAKKISFTSRDEKTFDRIETKNAFAFYLNGENKEKIETWLDGVENG